VTTLRRDVETDGRHAQVEFTTDWRADAWRRDLTINALYADQSGLVHDYTGGLEDIEKANIRFIGDARKRIAEDHLRILRFFRFFAHYGRGRPDAQGIKASAVAKEKIRMLSAERVWSEMKKLLSANDPFRALLWMRTAGVLTVVLPETEKWGIDAVPALVAAEGKFGWAPDLMLRLAAIVPPDAERLMALADRLKLSTAERGYLKAFAEHPTIPDQISGPQFDAMLYMNGVVGAEANLKIMLANMSAKAEGKAEELPRVARLGALLDRAMKWRKPAMPVKGADLIEAGFDPGPLIGEKLATLEEQWVASNFKLSKDELLAKLKH
jgi:poly(A) polymerase